MINKKRVLAIIPVRAGSRRLPNKNILPFANSNLLIHKIRQLQNVEYIDEIVVSSDSDTMLEMAKNEGVSTQKRPVEYCDEKTKTFNEVVEYIISRVQADIIVWAPCVCPLTSVSSYRQALLLYKEKVLETCEFDAVLSAKSFKEYLYDEIGPKNFLPASHIPSQKLPDWKVIVNGFYIASRKDLLRWKFLYGTRPYFFVLNKKEACDIDDAEDFEVAKALLNLK